MSASASSDAHVSAPRAWVRTSPHTAYLTADNPGDMTLGGTNTYVVGALGDQWPPAEGAERPSIVVVDPGPDDAAHADAVAAAGDVVLILLTHRHADHTGNAARLRELTGAPVRGWTPELSAGAAPLEDGEVVSAAEVELFALHCPGHTSDSVCLRVDEDSVILTGDTVPGEGTTMLDYPDGDLEDYLDTLRELMEHRDLAVLPAHGPAGESLHEACDRLLDHRLTRIHELRQRLKATEDDIAPSAGALASSIYGDVPAGTRESALKTLKAQLAYLVDIGEIAGFTD
ncbi:MBL fold metallo-hydrolase [Rothia sp. AR01]|uniref:MBL fold metallo-hydrolase n=1 Tax=Rothia santali TaxID=2949643 RepID=A0A9X2HBU2_9MICC|nr:MBL fold metallo-hydrolase [Rothia santali]MCP3426749.1 MBL fold metallo-hydrolase [Rothia santali]